MILSSNDGMDEISISDVTYATTLFNGKMEGFEINLKKIMVFNGK